MKKSLKISRDIFSIIFPDLCYDEFVNLPRKKKKKYKLEKQINNKIKNWLEEYERKHRIPRVLP